MQGRGSGVNFALPAGESGETESSAEQPSLLHVNGNQWRDAQPAHSGAMGSFSVARPQACIADLLGALRLQFVKASPLSKHVLASATANC